MRSLSQTNTAANPPSKQRLHCAVQHHVVSDTVEQALDFISELEPDVSDLRLEQVLEETSRPDLLWGVYWRSPWVTGALLDD